ncbi:MAG: hypothetical protein V4693_22095 [Pseudomonadota bacterium]
MRRTLIKLGAAAMLAGCLAACGGAHDGSANLEPDPQAAPVRAAVNPNQAAISMPGPQPGGGRQ